jgi:hypothetical protein
MRGSELHTEALVLISELGLQSKVWYAAISWHLNEGVRPAAVLKQEGRYVLVYG